MNTISTLIAKFILTLGAAVIAFSVVDNNGFGWVFTLSILVTILNYLIGDRYILPQSNNITASAADGGLAALTAFLYGVISAGNDVGLGSLIVFALLVAGAEYLFHKFLVDAKKVEP